MENKTLKTELHHWWPKSLSKQWEDDSGLVSSVRPNGNVLSIPGKNFGAITNAHHLKLGGPWNSSFEPTFNRVDSEMVELSSWLLTLEAKDEGSDTSINERILAQTLPIEKREQMARCVASLIARSPRTRNAIKLQVEYYRQGFVPADPKADKTLISMNQRHLFDNYFRGISRFGRWAVLFSDSAEFVFGDGFFHNFPASNNFAGSGGKCFLPFTPAICLAFMHPRSHPSEPQLVTLRLDRSEVEILNQTVQLYASEFIFYRSQKPKIMEFYRSGTFGEYKYHKMPWIDQLADELSQYNLWGPNGSPSRSYPEGSFFRADTSLEEFLTSRNKP